MNFLRRLFCQRQPEVTHDTVAPQSPPPTSGANEAASADEEFATDENLRFDDLAHEYAEAFVDAMFGHSSDNLADLPAGRFRFIAIDVETATSDPASICQIGLAFVSADGIEQFCTLINPMTVVAPRNYAIHQIEDDDLKDAPLFSEAFEAMRPLLESHLVVQHSTFDRKALDAACSRNRLPCLATTWADSCVAARRAWPELTGHGGHGLANLRRHLHLDFRHHHAGDDAQACAEVVLAAERSTGLSFPDLFKSSPARIAKPVNGKGDASGPLHGEVLVFTGELSIPRQRAADLATSNGITVVANLTKKVTLLVVGDQDLKKLAGHEKSTKHRKAEDLIAAGQLIRIIGETDFLSLVGPKDLDPSEGEQA